MPLYETYEEILDANIGATDFEDREDVIYLCDWLLNEAYHKEKLIQLIVKRVKERCGVDLDDLITLKDLKEIPNVSLTALDEIEDESFDEPNCEDCDCEECPHSDGCSDEDNLLSKLLDNLAEDEEGRETLQDLLKALNAMIDDDEEECE